MKYATLIVLAALALLAGGCKKEKTTVMELRARCQHCVVRWNTGGEWVEKEMWYQKSYEVLAEQGETVQVEMQWLSHPNDTINVVVTYWDSIPYSMGAFLFDGGQLPLKSGGCFSPATSFSMSAVVPER